MVFLGQFAVCRVHGTLQSNPMASLEKFFLPCAGVTAHDKHISFAVWQSLAHGEALSLCHNKASPCAKSLAHGEA